MVKRFSKEYGNKGRAFNYLQSESYICQDACQRHEPILINLRYKYHEYILSPNSSMDIVSRIVVAVISWTMMILFK